MAVQNGDTLPNHSRKKLGAEEIQGTFATLQFRIFALYISHQKYEDYNIYIEL
jgi:hypothetical protein